MTRERERYEARYMPSKGSVDGNWYEKRVLALEDEGLTTSDAQGCADVELAHAWQEYDRCAEDLARRGLCANAGEPLPANMNALTVDLINEDIEAFQERVRDCAYGIGKGE